MKILVASKRTQGQRTNDFYHLRDGEPVYLGFVCDRDLEDPDGGCGCGRSFSGFDSQVGGTTAEVVESPLDRAAFQTRLRESLTKGGYGELIDAATLRAFGEELLTLAEAFPVGTILERRGEEIVAR